MKEAKFELRDIALMMYNDKPVKVIIFKRLFIQSETISKFSGNMSVDEYVEYEVCTHSGMEKRVREAQLFRTKEELFESFKL